MYSRALCQLYIIKLDYIVICDFSAELLLLLCYRKSEIIIKVRSKKFSIDPIVLRVIADFKSHLKMTGFLMIYILR